MASCCHRLKFTFSMIQIRGFQKSVTWHGGVVVSSVSSPFWDRRSHLYFSFLCAESACFVHVITGFPPGTHVEANWKCQTVHVFSFWNDLCFIYIAPLLSSFHITGNIFIIINNCMCGLWRKIFIGMIYIAFYKYRNLYSRCHLLRKQFFWKLFVNDHVILTCNHYNCIYCAVLSPIMEFLCVAGIE